MIDASIMPLVVSANTNAAAIMIGERGADLVKEQWEQSSPEHCHENPSIPSVQECHLL